MEINKMLSLCTAHVTERTAHILENYSEMLQVVVYDKPKYGWFVHVPDDFKLVIEVDMDTCPKDLYDCLELAHKNGCGWLNFDADVEPLSELTVYR